MNFVEWHNLNTVFLECSLFRLLKHSEDTTPSLLQSFILSPSLTLPKLCILKSKAHKSMNFQNISFFPFSPLTNFTKETRALKAVLLKPILQ